MTSDELSQRERALLDAARRADDPTAADRARIDVAMFAKLGALAMPGPASTQDTSEPAAANGAAARGLLGTAMKTLLALGAVCALWFGLRARVPEPSRAPDTHAATIGPQPAAATSSVARPRVELQVDGVAKLGAAEPDAPAAFGGKPALRPAHARVPAQTAADGDSLAAEMALIAPAERALRSGQYAAARVMLEQHTARFPNGVLREERRGLHVLALCGLGQLVSGREERASFLRDAPSSVLASKVRAACAEPNAQPRAASGP